MRGIVAGGLVALITVAWPGAATAGTPEQIAQRLATATDLRSAVAATEDALVAGGIGIVENGTVSRRGVAPAAPVAASGMEVLDLALEAMHKRSAGGTTLAALATQLRSAGFPFPRPRRAATALRAFLAVWAGTDRRSADPRAFAPRFLAAMARRQGRPIVLTRADYPPSQLRLTSLEVQLLVAGLQRGPRRLWKGTRPKPRTLAQAAQDDPGPCSDFRKFQKAQLEELFGKDVASDLDRVLDYGFGMIAGEANPMEKGLEKAVEKGLLGYKGAKAKAVSGQFAKRAMRALNILLRIQKLAVLYGSVELVAYPAADTFHEPRNDKTKFAFGARTGIDPDKAADYQALVDERAKETDAVKALRDCLKLLKLPSLADVGDIAEEMEKWRIHWSFSMLPNHAEINVRDTKYDAGSFKQSLHRINAFEAETNPVFVNIKPESDRDHAGCNPPLRTTYVSATATLDTSQPPDLGTAIDALTGQVFGVAVEAAEQIFRATVTPSSTGTVAVTYHVPDKATARQAGAVCRAQITAHVRSTAQCAGQPEPVVTDEFDLQGSSSAGTVTGHHDDYFDGNGCTSVGDQEVAGEPVKISVEERDGRLYLSWTPSRTLRWARVVDVPAASGTYTVPSEDGDENLRTTDTVTVTVALQ